MTSNKVNVTPDVYLKQWKNAWDKGKDISLLELPFGGMVDVSGFETQLPNAFMPLMLNRNVIEFVTLLIEKEDAFYGHLPQAVIDTILQRIPDGYFFLTMDFIQGVTLEEQEKLINDTDMLEYSYPVITLFIRTSSSTHAEVVFLPQPSVMMGLPVETGVWNHREKDMPANMFPVEMDKDRAQSMMNFYAIIIGIYSKVTGKHPNKFDLGDGSLFKQISEFEPQPFDVSMFLT